MMNKDFEQNIRQKFEGFQMEPPADAFRQINASRKSILRKKRIRKYWYGAAAILLLAGSLTAVFLATGNSSHQITPGSVEPNSMAEDHSNGIDHSTTQKASKPVQDPGRGKTINPDPSNAIKQKSVLQIIDIDSVICGLTADVPFADERSVLELSAGMAEVDRHPGRVHVSRPGTYTFKQYSSENGRDLIYRYQFRFIEMQDPGLPDKIEVCGNEQELSMPEQHRGEWMVEQGLTIDNQTDMSCRVTASTFGLYRMIWTEKSEGCTLCDTLMIHFKPTPEARINMDQGLLCEGKKIQVWTVEKSNERYEWNFGQLQAERLGDHRYWLTCTGQPEKIVLTVANESGCSDTDQLILNPEPSPRAGFEFILSEKSTPSQVYFTNTSQSLNPFQSIWYFGDGESSADQHPEHFYTAVPERPVSLVVTDENGCKDSVVQTIPLVTPSLSSKNLIITPNGDGINDYFKPNTGGLDEFTWMVFSPSGEQIFTGRLDSDQWDGRLASGNEALSGLYFYLVKGRDSTGKYRELSGSLYLVRK